jgi:hypothetical protein
VGSLIDHHQLEDRIPIAGDFAGWVIEDIEKAVVRHYIKDPAAEAAAVVEDQKKYLDAERRQIAEATKQAFLDAANQEGLDPDSIDVKSGADQVFHDVNHSFADGKGR